MFSDESEEQSVGGKIAVSRNSTQDLLIQFIVKVTPVRSDVKEPQCTQPSGLMYLKI